MHQEDYHGTHHYQPGRHPFQAVAEDREGDNRSTPNLIETILKRYLEDAQFVDALEMASCQADSTLQHEIKRSWSDYTKGRHAIVK